MTATALTEAEEFSSIYGLDTIVVPTNNPVVRKDANDVVYRSQEGKFKAIVEDIKEHHEKGQPILVGTPLLRNLNYSQVCFLKREYTHNVLKCKTTRERS